VNKKTLIGYSALLVLGCGSLTFEQSAHATGFGDFMNPGKWFGGNRNRGYDDDYYYDRYRYGGYGPGYGYGGPYGYGGGYGSYGGYGGGYGPYGGWPGYGAPGYNQQKSETPLPPIPQ